MLKMQQKIFIKIEEREVIAEQTLKDS